MLLVLSFGMCAFFFGRVLLEDGELSLIVPAVIFTAFTILFICVLLKYTIIGLNNYHFENNSLQIMRKNKQIARIDKNEIEELSVVSDVLSQDIHFITLRAHGRKWVVFISDENKEGLSDFIEGLPCERKNNLWYYLLELISW